MVLREFLRALPLGGQAEFAKRVGVAPAYLSQLSSGFRDAGIEIAARIERETAGAVTVEELRPDVDWAVIRGKPAPAAEQERAA